MKRLERFQKHHSHSKEKSGLFGFWLRFGSVMGFFKPTLSPKPRQNSKILAPNGYGFSSSALLCCFLIIAAAFPVGRVAAYEYAEVTLDYVAAKALQRAQKPFHSPKVDFPDFLREDKLNYDKYREIEFRHEDALWANQPLPFRVEFFHPGYIYQEPVHINEFTLTYVQPVRFVQDWFNYRALKLPKQIPADTGYAGFKLLYPLNEANKWDELGAIIGASYFRFLGKGQSYGESARGLALDCGETDRPEEFPIFTDWWLGKPSQGEDRLKMYAILDSVSCVGAYRFVVIPGQTTVVDVDAILYFREGDKVRAVNPDRKPIKTIGIAPFSSMFWYGKASERRFDNYRPEVHDNDGLLMKMSNGEVLWRPLVNPAKTSHQVFATKSIAGFGLIQRDRNFSDYQDLFNGYVKTPSVWVRPNGGDAWKEGEIHLLEFSTTNEYDDNIAMFWNPKDQPAPLQPFKFSYTLLWGTNENDMKLNFDRDRVVATRVGVDPRDPKIREFMIDFAGPKLKGFSETNKPQAITSCSANAGIAYSEIYYNPYESCWRVDIKLEPHNQDPVDIRCTLQKGEEVLTETWTYHWSPP
jgi:periplasmic glucans biosynthesis protein